MAGEQGEDEFHLMVAYTQGNSKQDLYRVQALWSLEVIVDL